MTGYKTASSIGWTLVTVGFLGGLVQGLMYSAEVIKEAKESYDKAAEEAAKSAEEARKHTGKK